MTKTTKTLFILRGLPGAGKSTFVRERLNGLTPFALAPKGYSPVSVSADHYFTDLATGEYTFDVTKLGPAHASAQVQLVNALWSGREVVVVDNTHTQAWEYKLALELGRAYAYKVEIIDLFDGGCSDEELAERNTHGVPEAGITRMRERYEEDSRSPLPKARLRCPECDGTWSAPRNHGKTIKCPRCFEVSPSFLVAGSGREDEYPEDRRPDEFVPAAGRGHVGVVRRAPHRRVR
jgi:predicted kinase